MTTPTRLTEEQIELPAPADAIAGLREGVEVREDWCGNPACHRCGGTERELRSLEKAVRELSKIETERDELRKRVANREELVRVLHDILDLETSVAMWAGEEREHAEALSELYRRRGELVVAGLFECQLPSPSAPNCGSSTSTPSATATTPSSKES